VLPSGVAVDVVEQPGGWIDDDEEVGAVLVLTTST
jgi:hypothetical protein